MRATLLLLLSLVGAASAADYSFTGEARDPDTGALLYMETHAVSRAGTAAEQRVVLYRCDPDAPPFARKFLAYGTQRLRPEFEFVDARSRHTESLALDGARLLVSAKAGAAAPLRVRALSSVEALVADAGFDEFVRGAWDPLQRGDPLEVPFLVPTRLDSVDFRARKLRDTSVDGAAASIIRLSLAGPLGWFLPDIDVTYRNSDRRLLRYRGLSNIRDASGSLLQVQIDFRDTARSNAPVDLAALRAQPLAACGS